MLDLVIRHGTIVTAEEQLEADIGIQDGVVVEIGSVGPARHEVDATGLQVLPGGVDVHTHLDSQPSRDGPRSPDDYYSGTVAAACGGVTTIIDYARQYPDMDLASTIDHWQARADGNAVIDYGFHLIPTDFSQATLDQIPALIEAGFPSFKIFMMRVADDDVLRMLRVLGSAGGLAMLHCESAPVDADAYRRLAAAGQLSARFWPEARPQASEYEASGRAVDYCAYTGSPIYIVHVSCAEAVERLRAGKAKGLPIAVETRPCYLLLSRDRYEEDSPQYLMYTGYPPLREVADIDALWAALADRTIDTVASDHAAWALDQKVSGADDFTRLPIGLPSLETQMRAIYSEGVSKGRIGVQRFVEVMSTNPARLLGLYPQKGTLAVGSDADVVLFDPRRRETIRYASLHSRCGYEPCEGLECLGWPVLTIARGEIVARDGEFVGQCGYGRLLRRVLPGGGAGASAATATLC